MFSEKNVKFIELLHINEAFSNRAVFLVKRQQNCILVPVKTTLYYFILNFSPLMTTGLGHSTIFRSPLEYLAYKENSQNFGLTTCAVTCDSTYKII